MAICVSDHPLLMNDQIMLGSRVWFSGSADRMALFRVISNPRWAAIVENFEWPYLRKGSCYPLCVKILW